MLKRGSAQFISPFDNFIENSQVNDTQIWARQCIAEESFFIDAAKLWNNTNNDIKKSETKKAKKEIKRYCKTFPI